MSYRTDRVARATVVAFGLALAACGEPPIAPPPPAPPPPAPEAPTVDLNAGWIERLPRISYVYHEGDPAGAGWPLVGQAVTWRAHVRAWADAPVAGVEYVWRLDALEVARGTVDVPPDGHIGIDLPWTWEFARHSLEIELDPADRIPEPNEANNRVEIDTDALAVGFAVERGIYDRLHETQRNLRGLESNSFEDWAQRQMRLYNGTLARATYAGEIAVNDRVRLDRVEIVPDGAIVAEGRGLLLSEAGNTTVDMSWGFPSRSPRAGLGGLDALTVTADPTAYIPFVEYRLILHEMMHQRGLGDLYAYRVRHGSGAEGSMVRVEEDGQLVAGGDLMPPLAVAPDFILLYEPPDDGLMNRDPTYVSLTNTLALNLWSGRRTPWAVEEGRRVTAGFLDHLGDLPTRNRVHLVEPDGTALGGASVRLFQDGELDNAYRDEFDATPDLSFTADGSGRVSLGHNPFGPVQEPDRSRGRGYKAATLLLRIEHEGRVAYEWMPAYPFNTEFWLGHEAVADYELVVTFRR